MFYTKELIVKNLKDKLPEVEIFVKHEQDSEFFIIDYKGFKAKVNITNFLVRLDEKQSRKSDRLMADFIFNIEKNLLSQSNFDISTLNTKNILEKVYPVLRSVSFAKNSKQTFIKKEHTNETTIYYAIDLENSYKLIDEKFFNEFEITEDVLHDNAIKNLAKLPLKYNVDTVADNTFYFLNAKDGYDGARLLDDNVLKYFWNKIKSPFYVGLPHQDTLIIADVKNKKGLEILQKMMVHFFTEGRVPITTITFKYDGTNLESLFIFVE